jgi:hypothetical protein
VLRSLGPHLGGTRAGSSRGRPRRDWPRSMHARSLPAAVLQSRQKTCRFYFATDKEIDAGASLWLRCRRARLTAARAGAYNLTCHAEMNVECQRTCCESYAPVCPPPACLPPGVRRPTGARAAAQDPPVPAEIPAERKRVRGVCHSCHDTHAGRSFAGRRCYQPHRGAAPAQMEGERRRAIVTVCVRLPPSRCRISLGATRTWRWRLPSRCVAPTAASTSSSWRWFWCELRTRARARARGCPGQQFATGLSRAAAHPAEPGQAAQVRLPHHREGDPRQNVRVEGVGACARAARARAGRTGLVYCAGNGVSCPSRVAHCPHAAVRQGGSHFRLLRLERVHEALGVDAD